MSVRVDEALLAVYAACPSQLNLSLCFCLMWIALEFVVSQASANLTSFHGKLSPKEGIDWDTTVVSQVHCIICTCFSFYVLSTAEAGMLADPLFFASQRAAVVLAFSTGYFYYETLTIFRYASTIGIDKSFLAHGVACSVLYTLTQSGFVHYYGICHLLFEGSTPFLNNTKLLKLAGLTDSSLQLPNQLAFVVSFFVVRIYHGLLGFSYRYQVHNYQLFNDVYLGNKGADGVVVPSLIICIGNAFLNLLNIFWSSRTNYDTKRPPYRNILNHLICFCPSKIMNKTRADYRI
jgi:hypothetical protein